MCDTLNTKYVLIKNVDCTFKLDIDIHVAEWCIIHSLSSIVSNDLYQEYYNAAQLSMYETYLPHKQACYVAWPLK